MSPSTRGQVGHNATHTIESRWCSEAIPAQAEAARDRSARGTLARGQRRDMRSSQSGVSTVSPAILLFLLSSQVCLGSRIVEDQRGEVAEARSAAQSLLRFDQQRVRSWPPSLELAEDLCEWLEVCRNFIDVRLRQALAHTGPQLMWGRASALREFDRRFHLVGFTRLDRLIDAGGVMLGDAFLSWEVRRPLSCMSGTLRNRTFALRSALYASGGLDVSHRLDDLLMRLLEMSAQAGC